MGGGGGGGGGEDGEWGARARRPNAGPERRGWGRGAGGSWRRRTTGSLSPAPPWIAGPGKRGLKPQPRVPGGGSLVSQSSSSTFPMVTVMDGDRAGPKNGSPPPPTTTTAHFPREILSLMLQNPPAMSRATSSPIDRGREGRSHGRTPRMAPPRAKGGSGTARWGGGGVGWGCNTGHNGTLSRDHRKERTRGRGGRERTRLPGHRAHGLSTHGFKWSAVGGVRFHRPVTNTRTHTRTRAHTRTPIAHRRTTVKTMTIKTHRT